jgi:hypothetical protein
MFKSLRNLSRGIKKVGTLCPSFAIGSSTSDFLKPTVRPTLQERQLPDEPVLDTRKARDHWTNESFSDSLFTTSLA